MLVIASFGVFALLSINLFGIFHYEMPMDGKMDPCPFMPGMSVCPMSTLEHASLMQGFFGNVPAQQSLTLLLIGLMFVASIGLVWIRRLFPALKELQNPLSYFYYQRHIPRETIFQTLFSDGILNPKLF